MFFSTVNRFIFHHASTLHTNEYNSRLSFPRTPQLPLKLPLKLPAITIKDISIGGILTSQPFPAYRACQNLFLRRRHASFPSPSTPATRLMILCALKKFGSNLPSALISPGLVELLTMVRKTSTINNYTPYFQKWQDFCLSHRIPFFSAPPLAVAAFRFEAAVGDHTASHTLNRCGAISFFCHMAGTPDPMTHPLYKQIKSALQRKLGLLGTKKTPLMYNQIIRILHERLTSTCEFDTLMMDFIL